MNNPLIYKTLTDKDKKEILLSKESWEHIQGKHPEITENMIENTLLEPDFINELRTTKEELHYYQLRYLKNGDSNQPRFTFVSVKRTSKDELMIDTAMTKRSLKPGGNTVFKKEEK